MAITEEIKTQVIVNGEEIVVNAVDINIQDVEHITLINLTPHDLVVKTQELLIDDSLRPGGWEETISSFDLVIPKSGIVTRIVEKSEISTRFLSYVLKTKAIRFSGLKDMPDPKPNTIFVISRIVGEKIKERKDVFFPGELIRDENGNIIGCEGLAYFE